MQESRNKNATPRPAPWLLLVFRLPAQQASHRVEIWRKLRRYGALALPSNGYLLPNRPEQREQFEWLACAIRSHKGSASVVEAHSFDDLPDERLVKLFSDRCDHEYQRVIQDSKAAGTRSDARRLSRLRRRLLEIADIDFFGSSQHGRAEDFLQRITGAARPRGKRRRDQFHGRTWVTRPRPGIDRCASAWLITRFLDPAASFAFATDPKHLPDAIPFDMYGGAGFGHRGNDCTFETLVKEFKLRGTGLLALAEAVHDADLGDEKFGRSEGKAVAEVLAGWARQGLSDDELLRRGMELMDGLYLSWGGQDRARR